MDRFERLDKNLSRTQKETYAKICEVGKYTATGHNVRTCNILMQMGLIKPDPDSRNINDYVIKGKPLVFTQTLPRKKEILEKIGKDPVIGRQGRPIKRVVPFNPEPKMQRPPAIYSNQSREEHIDRILNM